RNIKPVMGLVVPYILNDIPISIILYAKSNKGYQQLISISTMLETEEDSDLLSAGMDELICIIPTETAVVQEVIMEDRLEQITEHFTPHLHKEDLYIGLLSNHVQEQMIEKLRQIEQNIKTVALHDVRYVAEQDFISYDCLQAMHHGQKWTKDDIQEEGHRYMATTQEMETAFSAW